MMPRTTAFRAAHAGLLAGALASCVDAAVGFSEAGGILSSPLHRAGAYLALTAFTSAYGALAGLLLGVLLHIFFTTNGFGRFASAFLRAPQARTRSLLLTPALLALLAGVLLQSARLFQSTMPVAQKATRATWLIAGALAATLLVACILSGVHPKSWHRIVYHRRLLTFLVASVGSFIALVPLTRSLCQSILLRFHHPGLMAALFSTQALAVVGIALFFGGIFEHLAARIFHLPRLTLDSRPVDRRAIFTSVVIALTGVGIAVLISLPTLRLLALRPIVLAVLFFVLLLLFYLRFASRSAAALLLLPALFAFGLYAGRKESVRKVLAKSAFGEPVLALTRRVLDLDRDGYSAFLGGGDCNDRDRRIHPTRVDWPDDGLDADCSGSDATAKPASKTLPGPVPRAVPTNLNILLLTIDTLRADHLGAYGYLRPTSPEIDRLGREGTVFSSAYAHAPSTRYSMPAILVGRHPTEIRWASRCPYTGGCADPWPPAVAPQNLTLAERLKSLGYFTAAFLNYRFFEPRAGYSQGFDLYNNDNARLHKPDPRGGDPMSHGSSSREQAEVAISFLDQHQKDKFFLWVHFYDPHWVYEAHSEIAAFGTAPMDEYDGEIRFTDLYVGKVLDRLRQLGLYDRTLIILTGDHGEGFGEHNIRFHGYHLYNAQTQVPLILRVPGIAPSRPSDPVGHVDIIPTVLHSLGAREAAADPELSGASLLPLMTGEREPGRQLFQQVLYEGPVTRLAVVEAGYRMIWNVEPDNTVELYDLRQDPSEARDLAGQDSERDRLARMKRTLGAFRDRDFWGGSFAAEVLPFVTETPPPARPFQATFRGVGSLVGVNLPKKVAAGTDLPIETILSPDVDMNADWRIFIHVEGLGVFASGDHDPLGGRLPTTRWPAGKFIRDRAVVPIPKGAHGRLSVYFGFFQGKRRAEVVGPHDGASRVLLGSVDVE